MAATNPDDDAALIANMRAAAEATLPGRGTGYPYVRSEDVLALCALAERVTEAERERDDVRAICDEMNALSGDELNLTVDVIARMRVAEARVAALEGVWDAYVACHRDECGMCVECHDRFAAPGRSARRDEDGAEGT